MNKMVNFDNHDSIDFNVFRVQTEQNTYNFVHGVREFIHTIRPNRNDFTEIKEVQGWIIGEGWIVIDPTFWVENFS